jgi:hypothetical protein
LRRHGVASQALALLLVPAPEQSIEQRVIPGQRYAAQGARAALVDINASLGPYSRPTLPAYFERLQLIDLAQPCFFDMIVGV